MKWILISNQARRSIRTFLQDWTQLARTVLRLLFLYLTALSFPLRANAALSWVPFKDVPQAECDKGNDFESPSSFLIDCRYLANELAQPEYPEGQRLMQHMVVVDHAHGHKSFINMGLCQFSARSWHSNNLLGEKMLGKHLQQQWELVWPSFVPWFNDLIRSCVENENAGEIQLIQIRDTRVDTVLALEIMNLGRKKSTDIKNNHAAPSAEPRPQPASSSQRLTLPLPPGMDNEIRVNMGNNVATQPSDIVIREGLRHFYPACLRGTKLRGLGQSVCDWCGSCWHNKGIILAKGIDLFFQSGGWGGPLLAAWLMSRVDHPANSDSMGKMADALQQCSSQLVEMAAQCPRR